VPPNNILEVLSRKPLLVGVAASALGALWDMSSWDASTSDLPVWDAGEVGTLAGDAPIFIAQSVLSVLSES
jgi:hypothetical protein